jgi:SAM-dependent methyltransferase
VGRILRIDVERSGVWRDTTPPRSPYPRRGGIPIVTRPVRLTTSEGDVVAPAEALPVPDASIDAVDCLDALEYVLNDDRLLDEIHRVLKPGGLLRLRVPAAGPLAGIDPYNLLHYLVDTTHRGRRPYETSELGWRRHYRRADLDALLGNGRFRIERYERRRLAIGDAVRFVGMLLFRWMRPRHDRYGKVLRIAGAIERVEHHIVTPIGSVIELEAVRVER